MMGSPLYMSPEQVQSAKDLDGRTDIWSLGVILFELLTGTVPFAGEAFGEIAIKICLQPTPSPRAYRPDVAPGLTAIVGKCLEKERDRRYRNVAELAGDLAPFGSLQAKALADRIAGIIRLAGLDSTRFDPPALPTGLAVTQTPAGTLPAVGRTIHTTRRKAALVGTTILGAVVLGAIAGSIASLHRPGPQTKGAHVADFPSTVSAASVAQLPTRSGEFDDTVAPVLGASSPNVGPRPVPSSSRPSVLVKKKSNVGMQPPTPSAPSTLPVAAAPAASPHCDPPYYFDSDGNKLFKKECL